jgi:hypothetical protein
MPEDQIVSVEKISETLEGNREQFKKTVLEQLKRSHGDLKVYGFGFDAKTKIPAYRVVVKAPDRGDYKRFEADQKRNDPDAEEVLVRSCIVYPDTNAVQEILERYPACIAGVISLGVYELAAGTNKAEEEKF